MVREVHQKFLRAQTERTYYETRVQYWILGGRKATKRVVRNCAHCKTRFGKPQAQIMGQIPFVRLSPFQRTFTDVGVDFFDPMFVVIGRRSEKRCGYIFTCMTTRAVSRKGSQGDAREGMSH